MRCKNCEKEVKVNWPYGKKSKPKQTGHDTGCIIMKKGQKTAKDLETGDKTKHRMWDSDEE